MKGKYHNGSDIPLHGERMIRIILLIILLGILAFAAFSWFRWNYAFVTLVNDTDYTYSDVLIEADSFPAKVRGQNSIRDRLGPGQRHLSLIRTNSEGSFHVTANDGECSGEFGYFTWYMNGDTEVKMSYLTEDEGCRKIAGDGSIK